MDPQNLVGSEAFAPTNNGNLRVDIIVGSLIVCFSLLVAIVSVPNVLLVYSLIKQQPGSLDRNLLEASGAALFPIMALIMSIIGAYCFNQGFDQANFRSLSIQAMGKKDDGGNNGTT